MEIGFEGLKRRGLLVCGLLTALTACSSIPLSSFPKLARIDFLTTEIETIRIAIAVPLQFALMDPPANFSYSIKVDGEPVQEEQMALVESQDVADRANFPEDIPKNTKLHIFRMPPASAARFTKLREQQLKMKSEGKHGSVSIGIAGNFCKKSAIIEGPLLTSTYVLTSETGGWVTFLKDLDLRSQKDVQKSIDKIKQCVE